MQESPAPYKTLLSPLQVGAHTLRNRVIMGSMHTRLEHMDNPTARQIAFYRERAEGGVALIITGGFSPDEAGRMEIGSPILATPAQAREHRPITDAVHQAGAKILLQILHAGRYAKHDAIVGASDRRSPINRRQPRTLTGAEIAATIAAYIACAEHAAAAGYDGVEVMGSEGYLINQFTVPRTNDRTDEWGGDVVRRMRLPIAIVSGIRERLGPDFLIMYRISADDLVEGGATATEIDQLAIAVEAAGADIINTGIGWHEAQVPTIAYHVPRAAWRFAPARLKRAVKIPVIASNRINTPALAEEILAAGDADMISMARPMLADAHFVRKAQQNRADEINTCIACNQACLDHIFTDRVATCLVNPRACRETEFDDRRPAPRRVAIVGSGPAGLACAVTAAQRGHRVVLFEQAGELGGQINLARRIPGKQEFDELLRYYRRQLAIGHVDIRLATTATAAMLQDFDHVAIATGVTPRRPELPGIDHPKVVSYVDVLSGRVPVGRRVAIMGGGGIGFDVAHLLTAAIAEDETAAFRHDWGVDPKIATGGGLSPPGPLSPAHEVTILQRSVGRPGARLGVSTGWILRNRLRHCGVKILTGIVYDRIDDAGLHYTLGHDPELLAADTIILCTGQEPAGHLAQDLTVPNTLIGGARHAVELDALRAIDEGTRLAHSW